MPIHRVKFNVNTEYAYIQNFKILQSQSLLSSTSMMLYNLSLALRHGVIRTSWH